MALTPICEVQINAGPWVTTTGGVNAVAGDVVHIRLQDNSSVIDWYLEVVGTDETSTNPIFTGVDGGTHKVTTPATIPTFTLPAGTGKSFLLQSTVTGPGGPLVTTFSVYMLTVSAERVGSVGEAREGDQNFGWIQKVNPNLRRGAVMMWGRPIDPGLPTMGYVLGFDGTKWIGISNGNFVAGGDLTGTSSSQTVSKIQGVTISGTPVNGQALVATSPTAATWSAVAGGSWVAGGDISGTSTSQSVSRILGVTSPDPSLKADRDLVEVFSTTYTMVTPRPIVSDGTYLYVGQNGASSNSPVVWRLKMTGTTVTSAIPLDLSTLLGTIDRVSDLAQDSTYLYAACWDTGNIAVINKATMTVVGWGYTGGTGTNRRAVSVAADSAGNFYVVVNNRGLQKFSTAACIGSGPSLVAPTLDPGAFTNGFMIRYGGGKLWVTGIAFPASPVSRFDPATLALELGSPRPLVSDFQGQIAIYAFGSVWVSGVYGGAGTGLIHRLDPTTLAIISSITPAAPFVGTPGGLEIGPNAAGTAGAWVYATCEAGPWLGSIDPAANTWNATITEEGGDIFTKLEGIGVIGNYVFVAAWAFNAFSIVGVKYYNPVLATLGAVSVPATLTWSLRYTVIGGDLTGPIATAIVSKIQGVAISGTPALGNVLTASGPAAAAWAAPAVPPAGAVGDNAVAARVTPRGLSQDITLQTLNTFAAEVYWDAAYVGSSIATIKEDQFLRLYDGTSGYAMGTSATSATLFSVDLTTVDWYGGITYVGYESKQHTTGKQFVFVAGVSGYRRIEIGLSTGGAGAIVNTDATFWPRATIYVGGKLYLWDWTNKKIRVISNPNDLAANAMSISDLTANGTLPDTSFTGRNPVNYMTFDGTNIWCISGNNLYKVTLGGTVTTFTFGTPGTGRAVLWDGVYLWVTANTFTKRVLPSDADPANNGTAVTGGSAFNSGDLLGSDGTLIYCGLSTQNSGVSVVAIDPDTVQVVQEFIGPINPKCMASTSAGTNRRVVVGTFPNQILGTAGSLYALVRHPPMQVGMLQSAGARFKGQKTILYGSGNYYVTPDDHIICVSSNGGASSGAVTINFPAITPLKPGGNGGREIIVIDMSGSLGGGNTITLAAAAGETINGAGTVTMTGAYTTNTVRYCINPNGAFAGTGWVRTVSLGA